MSKLKAIATGATVICSLTVGFIAKWEGKSNKAYLDLVQVPTVCYGTTRNVTLGDVRTDDECIALLKAEIGRINTVLTSATSTYLKPNERAAIVSWAYNVGDGNMLRSTLLRKVKAGDIQGACNELTRWVYAGGRKVRGLVNRREAERKLCLG